MVKVFGQRKRRLFDEDADWLPSKGRVFTLKKNAEPPEPQNEVNGVKTTKSQADVQAKVKELKGTMPKNDAEGLDRAYASSANMTLDSQGTLYTAGTKGGFLGKEWIENYITMGAPLVSNFLG